MRSYSDFNPLDPDADVANAVKYEYTGLGHWSHRDEEFAYDGLHRLTASHRGVRDGSFEHAMTSREWTLDMLGNWDETATWSAGGFNRVETRDHSDANELTSRTPHGGSALNFTYDKAGNLESQETSGDTVTYTYDAWNRLVKIEYDTFTRAEYQYNGINWRIIKRADTSMPPDGELNQQRVMYYNADWQLLEEFINDDWSPQSADDDHDRRMQYIWGMRYIDDIALRKEWNAWSIVGTANPLNTWYHLTDTLFSTIAVMDEAANLIERVSYDAYGNAQHHRLADLTGDGGVDVSDLTTLLAAWGDYGVGDINRDGVVDVSDQLTMNGNWGAGTPAGQLSMTDNVIGYAGYVFNAEIHGGGLYTVRHRHYSPELGRWLTRDPAGYVDGMGLYEYVRSLPLVYRDPHGKFVLDEGPPFWPERDPNECPPGTVRVGFAPQTNRICNQWDPICLQGEWLTCNNNLTTCLGTVRGGVIDTVSQDCWAECTNGGYQDVDLALCVASCMYFDILCSLPSWMERLSTFSGCMSEHRNCNRAAWDTCCTSWTYYTRPGFSECVPIGGPL